MQCPNCRQVEGGQWLFSSSCYLQQQLLSNPYSDEDHSYTGMLDSLYRHDERLTHPSRRPPHGSFRQISIESDYPSSMNRGLAEVPPWNVRLNEMARPLASDPDSLRAVGMYIQSSHSSNIHRTLIHGNLLPNSHMLEETMPRQRMEEDEFLHHRETAINFANSHRYAMNRGAGETYREPAVRMVALPNVGHLEQSTESRIHDARYGQSGNEGYHNRRAGAYPSFPPSGREMGSSHESVRRVLANAYGSQVHHLHPGNRAGGSHSYYDGYQLRAARI
ncbi:hypothetical protein GOP47_0016881 [Adiantum capillus-veneris]|uniref:Uncharacterized protein n=1 Tax=Adiantum capillus-veneris TaxID=13818 RepID=A0A9D4UJG9_ADICA|nr:hypothetical protein GOP47_0016881 [Adiantum capillus-veneris]